MSLFYVQWDTDLYRLWAATPEHAAIALGQYLSLPDGRRVTVYPGVEIAGRIDPKPMLEQGCVYQLDIDDGVMTASAPHEGLTLYTVTAAYGDVGSWQVWAPTPEGAGLQVLERQWSSDWRWLVATAPNGEQWHVLPVGSACQSYYCQPEALP